MEKWEKIRKHIYVSGRVQGVGFRFRAQQLARGFGLTGWVKNLDDGRVEMELQGTEVEMDRLFERLRQDRYIRIDGFQTERISPVEENGFQVRY
ncbi:acylphosphatase [Lacrimispora indolis]|uniref:acylphosphatase n=1 Tax=Lacrimispora indolis TaxID=69825 RepID=UPI00041414A9|nr:MULTISPECIES: acylphosphatase [Lachnospiraceae]MBE7721540.1 acylphosphatase [Lacrimispora celerecrescens]